jgi:hypothetical protein
MPAVSTRKKITRNTLTLINEVLRFFADLSGDSVDYYKATQFGIAPRPFISEPIDLLKPAPRQAKKPLKRAEISYPLRSV